MGLACCPAPRPARPGPHITPKTPLVVLVFSFRLPQPHSGESLSLFPPLAFLNMEGNVGERSMSSRNAVASLQSTRCAYFPSRNRISSNRAWQQRLCDRSDTTDKVFGGRSFCRLFPSSSGCNACPHKSHLLRLETRASFWNRTALEAWLGFQGTHSFLSRGFPWYWPPFPAPPAPSFVARAPRPQQNRLPSKTLRKRKLLWGSNESRKKYSLPATRRGWIRASTCRQANMW